MPNGLAMGHQGGGRTGWGKGGVMGRVIDTSRGYHNSASVRVDWTVVGRGRGAFKNGCLLVPRRYRRSGYSPVGVEMVRVRAWGRERMGVAGVGDRQRRRYTIPLFQAQSEGMELPARTLPRSMAALAALVPALLALLATPAGAALVSATWPPGSVYSTLIMNCCSLILKMQKLPFLKTIKISKI